MTRIAILETGTPPRSLIPEFGRYDAMFRGLLGEAFQYETFEVHEGALPADPAAFDGLLITGSPAGVYDDLPWIAPLEAFLRRAAGQTRIAGVCFGHQVMASAFGGVVIKSPKGWGIGVQTYEMSEHPAWADAGPTISVPVSHQDQVVALPPAARAIGGNAFCPNGVVEYGGFPAISMQCHPEFDPAYERAIIERRLELYPPDQVDEALASLARPNDNARVGGWIARFLRG